MQLKNLQPITKDDIEYHIYELYSENVESGQDLGYINRTSNQIEISLEKSGIDLTILQSISQLSSPGSSTGFVCWNTSAKLADWILADDTCPFKDLDDKVILELGAGVGGICGNVLSQSCRKYVCSDQKPVLKLLRQNVQNSNVDVIEFDWEHIEQGVYNFDQISCEKPDLILACDTIYNEYLVPYFLDALDAMMTNESICIVGVQLRDDITLNTFLSKTVERFKLYTIEFEIGYAVYCIRR